MVERLFVDPLVAELNQYGINAAKASHPDFAGAHEALELGISYLSNYEESTVATEAQLARLLCDNVVVDVRQGLYQASQGDGVGAVTMLTGAYRAFDASLRITSPLTYGQGLTLEDYKFIPELNSHHGATLGVRARTVVASQIVSGEISRHSRAGSTEVAQQVDFGRNGARPFLEGGPNMYWQVSNDFNGMRTERINGGAGHALHILPWLYRGVRHIVDARRDDPDNFVPAVLTAGRLSLESLSRSYALRVAVDHRKF